MENKKNILHISAGGLGNGGVSTVILSIVKPLHDKYNFSCLVYHHKSSRENIYLNYGSLFRINCFYESRNKFIRFIDIISRPFKLFWNTYKICKSNKIDIIHNHLEREGVFCLLGAKLAQVPKRISHCHNQYFKDQHNYIENVIKKTTDIIRNFSATDIVGCSKEACESYNNYNFTVIKNSIDLSKFQWKINDSKEIKFIHVGRYCYLKNQEFVIKTFRIISKQIKNCSLLLIGFGEDEYKLKSLVSQYNLNDKIKFIKGIGYDIPNSLSNSDIMIFPSKHEGFGIALIEAQASGCYCFISDKIPNTANVGFTEILSLNQGEEKWANRIIQYINSDDYRFRNSKKSVVENNLKEYSEEYIAKKYIELYEQ